MKSSGSFQPNGRDGRAGFGAMGASVDCSGGRWLGGWLGQLIGRLARPRIGRSPGDWWIGWRGRGRSRGRSLAREDELDIAAPRRSREQHALQRGGAQKAALHVRKDGAQPAGAEADRDGVEIRAGGTVLRGLGEMAAETEHDANGVQHCGDARGHGPGGRIRLGIVGRGRTGSGGGALHPAVIGLLGVFVKLNNGLIDPGRVSPSSHVHSGARRWAAPAGRLLLVHGVLADALRGAWPQGWHRAGRGEASKVLRRCRRMHTKHADTTGATASARAPRVRLCDGRREAPRRPQAHSRVQRASRLYLRESCLLCRGPHRCRPGSSRVWRRGLAVRGEGRGSFRGLRQLCPAVRGAGQAEILAQCHAFILRPEKTAPLQFRDDHVDEIG